MNRANANGAYPSLQRGPPLEARKPSIDGLEDLLSKVFYIDRRNLETPE
jgi:hypothetical protein